jgi:ketosteroid isomerase-like protein
MGSVAPLDHATVEHLCNTAFSARAKGDIEAMLSVCSDDIVYQSVAAWRVYPGAVPRQGKEAVRDLLNQISVEFAHGGFDIEEIIIEGRRAMIHRSVKVHHRGTNASGTLGVVDVITVNEDGLVSAVVEYFDTLHAAELAGKIEYT